MPKIELDDPLKCKECNHYNCHAGECSQINIEDLRTKYINSKKANESLIKQRGTYWGIWQRLRNEVTFWKGKHLIVKHENNQLRKKIMNNGMTSDEVNAIQDAIEKMAELSLIEIHKHATLCTTDEEKHIFVVGFHSGYKATNPKEDKG